jgi:hypothetical protein
MTISDQFEELIDKKQIQFNEVKLTDPWVRSIVKTFLEPANISWKLGDKTIGNACCIKIDDEFLQYVDILPDTEEFVWCTDDHHRGVHPDVASAYLMTKTVPGATARCWEEENGDRIMETTLNGATIRIVDREVNGDRVISYERIK